MERKHKFEILFAIILIAFLIGVVWWLLRPDIDDGQVVDEDSQMQGIELGQEPLDLDGYEEDASTIARVFVERFGSFSNHGDYENVDAVMDLATESLQVRLNELVDEASSDDGSVYYGVSTYVLSIDQVEVSDTQEVLEVLTQREESFETPGNTSVKYQTMQLTMTKVADQWLVDDFQWLD